MKGFVKRKLSTWFSASVAVALASGEELFAQGKVPDITKIKGEVEKSGKTIIDIVAIVLGVVLALGLIWVIYAVATNHPKAKESVIAWLVAAIFYGIAWAIMGF